MKKRLRNQLKGQSQRNNARRWLWCALALFLLAVAVQPLYQRYRQTAPQRLRNQALKLEAQGSIEAAQQVYQNLYQKYPDSELAPEALLRSGRIWQQDRQHDQQALLSFLQLEHDYPDSSQVESAREEAAWIVKYSLHDYSRAIEFYQRLRDTGTDKVDKYLYEIADCYFRLDNYTQARIELETLIEQFPQSKLLSDVLYRKGGLHLLENQFPAAREAWQQLIKEFPESLYAPQAKFNLGKILEEEDRLQEALELYQQLTDYPRPALLEEKIEHLKQRIKTKKKAI